VQKCKQTQVSCRYLRYASRHKKTTPLPKQRGGSVSVSSLEGTNRSM